MIELFEDTLLDPLWGWFVWFLRFTGEVILYGLTMGNYRRGRRGFAESLAPVTVGILFWVMVVWFLIKLL